MLLEDKQDKKIVIAFGKAEKMYMFPDAFKKGFFRLTMAYYSNYGLRKGER